MAKSTHAAGATFTEEEKADENYVPIRRAMLGELPPEPEKDGEEIREQLEEVLEELENSEEDEDPEDDEEEDEEPGEETPPEKDDFDDFEETKPAVKKAVPAKKATPRKK